MWHEIALKVNKLKELDKLFVVFGASIHKYTFGDKLTESEIVLFEQQNDIELPTQLREFYLFFGDGGTGPDYGMYSLENLCVYKENQDDDFFYDFNEDITSFICIMDRYYAYDTCIVSSGKKLGHLYGLENGAFQYDEGNDLVKLYDHWLNDELHNFKTILEEINHNHDITEIMYNLFLLHGFQPIKTISYLSSLINLKNFGKVNLSILPRLKQTDLRKIYLPEKITSAFNFNISLYMQKQY